ncbi:hypothetical protein NL676_024589 [Syzygium grande]|nr:hypothetical protein NL676_024589 [Syzygium grande]
MDSSSGFKRVLTLVAALALFTISVAPLAASASPAEAQALLKWKSSLGNRSVSSLSSWTPSPCKATNSNLTVSSCAWAFPGLAPRFHLPIPRLLPVLAEPKSLWFPSLETTSFGSCSTPSSSLASGAGGAEIAPISFVWDDLLRSLLHLPHSSPAFGAGGAEIAPVSFAREDLLRPLLLSESVLVSCLFFPLGLDRDSGANFEPASAQRWNERIPLAKPPAGVVIPPKVLGPLDNKPFPVLCHEDNSGRCQNGRQRPSVPGAMVGPMLGEAAHRLVKSTLNIKLNNNQSSGILEPPRNRNFPGYYAVNRPRPAAPSRYERGFSEDTHQYHGNHNYTII